MSRMRIRSLSFRVTARGLSLLTILLGLAVSVALAVTGNLGHRPVATSDQAGQAIQNSVSGSIPIGFVLWAVFGLLVLGVATFAATRGRLSKASPTLGRGTYRPASGDVASRATLPATMQVS